MIDLFTPQPSEAQKLAQAGATLAADYADRLSNGVWKEAAYVFLLEYMRTHPEFQCYQVRQAADGDAQLPDGAKGQSWGAVIQRAQKAGLIRSTGYRKTDHIPSHSRKQEVWQVIPGNEQNQ